MTPPTAQSLLQLARNLPEPEAMDVPALGGTIHLRPMSAAARDAWEAKWNQSRKSDAPNLRGSLLAAMLANPDGSAMFTSKDADTLAGLPADAIAPVFDRCLALAGLTGEDADELAGKSETTPAAG